MIEGVDESQDSMKELMKRLKSKLACGGTVKEGRIELQGNHKTRVKDVLVEIGFTPEMIDLR